MSVRVRPNRSDLREAHVDLRPALVRVDAVLVVGRAEWWSLPVAVAPGGSWPSAAAITEFGTCPVRRRAPASFAEQHRRLRTHHAADQHVDLRNRVARQTAQRRLPRLDVVAAARVGPAITPVLACDLVVLASRSRRCRQRTAGGRADLRVSDRRAGARSP